MKIVFSNTFLPWIFLFFNATTVLTFSAIVLFEITPENKSNVEIYYFGWPHPTCIDAEYKGDIHDMKTCYDFEYACNKEGVGKFLRRIKAYTREAFDADVICGAKLDISYNTDITEHGNYLLSFIGTAMKKKVQ